MPIEHHKGGTTITGESMKFFRILQLRAAVSLECKGLKVRRGRVIWKQVKKEFNIKGNKHAVLAWLEAKVQEESKKQEHITEDGKRYVDGKEVQ